MEIALDKEHAWFTKRSRSQTEAIKTLEATLTEKIRQLEEFVAQCWNKGKKPTKP
jgi:hypothetical protein